MTQSEHIYTKLKAQAQNLPTLSDMFAKEAGRAGRMSYSQCGLYVDISKQSIHASIWQNLLKLAADKNIPAQRDALFAGEKINTSENRAVLHPALRGSSGHDNVQKQVDDMRVRTGRFCEKITASGRFEHIVHIGIGGSDLGPRLLADAFAATGLPAFGLRFANNIDAASIHDALAGLNPKTTLVIIVSKSFSTQETKLNAISARRWLGDFAKDNMVAVTANRTGAQAFGIGSERVFEFWDWVGGRFSLWSAVSLSVQLAYGVKIFDRLLAGAAHMDAHFLSAPLENNLPVALALVDVWNRNFLGLTSRAVVPYVRRLRKLPSFLQQLEMESGGKMPNPDTGFMATSPLVWGGEGSNVQHAFFQQLHQGPDVVPVEFIAVLTDQQRNAEHHRALLANCFAQSQALMMGRHDKDLPSHKIFPGNRPSTTIMLDKLDAHTLGALLALYEHKVFCTSVIWGINAFDQWGVELGKVLAGDINAALMGKPAPPARPMDSSTAGLIALARASTKS